VPLGGMSSPPLLVKWLCLCLGRLVEDQLDLIALVPQMFAFRFSAYDCARLVHISWHGDGAERLLNGGAGTLQVSTDALALLSKLLVASHPEVRAAAIFALSICIQVRSTLPDRSISPQSSLGDCRHTLCHIQVVICRYAHLLPELKVAIS
jgi:hypothetical protein